MQPQSGVERELRVPRGEVGEEWDGGVMGVVETAQNDAVALKKRVGLVGG